MIYKKWIKMYNSLVDISDDDILGGDRYEQRDTTDRGSLLYIISS